MPSLKPLKTYVWCWWFAVHASREDEMASHRAHLQSWQITSTHSIQVIRSTPFTSQPPTNTLLQHQHSPRTLLYPAQQINKLKWSIYIIPLMFRYCPALDMGYHWGRVRLWHDVFIYVYWCWHTSFLPWIHVYLGVIRMTRDTSGISEGKDSSDHTIYLIFTFLYAG